MSNFTKKFNQLLNETPWYDMKLEIPIDLRFELVKSKEELLSRLYAVVHDVSNRLYIHENLIEFMKEVMNDEIFLGFLKRYNCKDEVESFFDKSLNAIASGEFYKEPYY